MTRREDVMNVARNVSEQAPPVEAEAPRSSMPLRVARFALLPLSVLLWALGVSRTNTASLGLYGLPAVLPLIYYAGIGLLLVSAGIEFSRTRLSQARLAAHAVALVVMLYATAPLLYKEGRYAWLYKTAGIVQYVSAHGSLDRSIDIYQNWPGFFAFASWFDNVAGVSSPLDYAKWAQLVVELAAIPLLCTIFQALRMPVWHRWLAIMLYAASNWIAQDYFSPQALSTVLSLGIMALAARWMFTATPAERRPLRESAPFIGVLVFLFFVMTASHEISPYIIIIQIAALALIGTVRPRWIALVIAAIALAYLAPNFSYVNTHYGLLSSLGNFFSNVQPPSLGTATPPASHKVIAYSADLLSAGIWLLALIGAWRRRRAGRSVTALLLLTFTPILVLVGGAYGNEGILRVFLFSLPWAVALASYALAPMREPAIAAAEDAPPGQSFRLVTRVTAIGAAVGRAIPTAFVSRFLTGPIARCLTRLTAQLRAALPAALRTGLRAVLPLVIAVMLFFPAFFGNDASDVMQPSEVNTITSFLQTAEPGPVLAAIDNAPGSDTAGYNEFPEGSIFDSPGFIEPSEENSDIAAFLARTIVNNVGVGPAYVVVTPSMLAYNKAFGITDPANITMLLASLAKSPYWRLAVSQNGTLIYELTDAAGHIPAGPSSPHLILGVP